MKKFLKEKEQELILALIQGPIKAIGGIVYSKDMDALMNTTDLFKVAVKLAQKGIYLRRTDSGGSPTWVGKA